MDALLDSLTPEEFNEWIAFDCLEGINEGWRQTAEMCATVTNCIAAAMGSKQTPVSASELIPRHPLDRQPKRKKKTISVADDEAAMAAQYGSR